VVGGERRDKNGGTMGSMMSRVNGEITPESRELTLLMHLVFCTAYVIAVLSAGFMDVHDALMHLAWSTGAVVAYQLAQVFPTRYF
jgi:hypothetical protein